VIGEGVPLWTRDGSWAVGRGRWVVGRETTTTTTTTTVMTSVTSVTSVTRGETRTTRWGGGRGKTMKMKMTTMTVRTGATTMGASDGAEDDGADVGRRRAMAAVVGVASAVATARASGGARAATGVLELTPENFEREVTKNAGAVFVEFYAPWCPYCKRLEPIWNELPSKLEEVGSKTRVARMNVDTYTEYASAYAVTGFPTLMLFENGRPVGAKTGLVDMKMAMRYAGVQDEGILAQFAPEKKLDKVLSGAQIEYVQGQVGAVRKELAGIEDVDSRARALEALQQIESIVGVRTL